MIREAVPEDACSIEELYRILLPAHQDIHVLPERLKQIAANEDKYL